MGDQTTKADGPGRPDARNLAVAAVLLILGSACSPVGPPIEWIESTAPLGTLPGDVSVTGDGQLVFSMPIEVPPGRGGVEPRVSIRYSSASGESSLGVGFSIQGLSAVNRCPRTISQDGVPRGVRLDDQDALCLDGVRLVGDPEAEDSYRTEQDQLLRISALRDLDGISGISGFVVESPDGTRLTFGADNNSRQLAERREGTVAATWFLSEVTDNFGNFMSFEYDHILPPKPGYFDVPEDDLNDVFRNETSGLWEMRQRSALAPLELVQIRRITYTGHRDAGGRTVAPDREVRFHYVDLPDGTLPASPGPEPPVCEPGTVVDGMPCLDLPTPPDLLRSRETHGQYASSKDGFFAGHYFWSDGARRLEKISTAVEGRAVREYRFEGVTDPVSNRWRIESIEGCAAGRTDSAVRVTRLQPADWVCLPEHRFEWLGPRLAAEGDGIFPVAETDYFETFEMPWPRKRNATPPCAYEDAEIGCKEPNPVLVLDVNGDGADDVAFLAEDEGLSLLFGGQGDRFLPTSSPGRSITRGNPLRGPFPTSVTLRTFNEVQWVWEEKVDPKTLDYSYDVIDYDLDGRDDILYLSADGQMTVLRSTGRDFEVTTEGLPRFDVDGTSASPYGGHLTSDLDGDGRTDILACLWTFDPTPASILVTPARWHYALRTGDGFGPLTDSGIVTNCFAEDINTRAARTLHNARSPGKVLGDYDGDGQREILIAPDHWTDLGDSRPQNWFRMLRWNHDSSRLEAIRTNVQAGRQSVSIRPFGTGVVEEWTEGDRNTIRRPLPVDLNGDGAHDLVGLRSDPSIRESLSRGATETSDLHLVRLLSIGLPGQFLVHDPGGEEDNRPFLARLFGGEGAPQQLIRRDSFRLGLERFDGVHSVLQHHAFDLNNDGRGDILAQTLPSSDTREHPVSSSVSKWADSSLWSLQTRDGMDESAISTTRKIRGLQHHDEAPGLTPVTLVLDADGDGALDLLEFMDVREETVPEAAPWLRVHRNVHAHPLLLTAVTNGLGAIHRVRFEPLSNSEVYTAGNHCSYPVRCVTSSLHVVRELSLDSGVESERTIRYHYENGRVDMLGRGWLGFSRVRSNDTATGNATLTLYNGQYDPILKDYPFLGRVGARIERRRANEPADDEGGLRAVALHTINFYESVVGTIPGTYRVQQPSNLTLHYQSDQFPTSDLDTVAADMRAIGRAKVDRTFDELGHPISVTTSYGRAEISSRREVVETTFANNQDDWLLGIPTSVTSTQFEGARRASQEVRLLYDDGQTRPREIVHPTGGSTITTTLAYDSFGHLIESLSRAEGHPDRRRRVEYELGGYFPQKVTNEVGHEVSGHHSDRNGLAISLKDSNGVESLWRYDGFGRVRRSSREGAPGVEYAYSPARSPGLALRMARLVETGAYSETQLDRLGRVRFRRDRAFDGEYETEVRYDVRGFAREVSSPYSASPVMSAPSAWTTVERDELGLVRSVEDPDGVATSYWYGLPDEALGTVMKVTDGAGHQHRVLRDTLGRTVRVEEPGDSPVDLHFFGDRLAATVDSRGNQIRVSFDGEGRIDSIDNPNSGVTSFAYTPFGQLSSVRNPSGETSFTYDALGRTVQRTHTTDGASTYEFDSALRPDGRPVVGLHRSTGPTGIVDTLQYDDLARPSRLSRQFGSIRLDVGFELDRFGRTTGIDYPTRLARPLRVEYEYASSGELVGVRSAGTSLWETSRSSPFGVPQASRVLGNLEQERSYSAAGRELTFNVTESAESPTLLSLTHSYDSRGSLLRSERRESERRADWMEEYVYDALHRLSRVRSDDPRLAQTYEYDELGNLTSSHDHAELSYPTRGERQPHAVQAVDSESWGYDAAGNATEKGDTRIAYSGRSLPHTISAGETETRFEYDSGGGRALSVRTRTGEPDRARGYIPGLYEYEETDDEPLRERAYVAGPTGTFLQIDRTEEGDRQIALVRDRLGSVIASWEASQLRSATYDAFGKVAESSLPSAIRLGFTGHEHEESTGLINMRGRVYDSHSRRFLSPDPYIGGLAAQGLNSYSYVFNDPLNYVDPSGYQAGPAGSLDNPIQGEEIRIIGRVPRGGPTVVGDTHGSGVAGGGAIGAASNSSAGPYGRPLLADLLLPAWTPSRPINTERMSPEQFASMAESAMPTLEVADAFAHGAVYTVAIVGAAVVAAEVIPAAALATIGEGAVAAGSWMMRGGPILGWMARYPWLRNAVGAVTSLLYTQATEAPGPTTPAALAGRATSGHIALEAAEELVEAGGGRVVTAQSLEEVATVLQRMENHERLLVGHYDQPHGILRMWNVASEVGGHTMDLADDALRALPAGVDAATHSSFITRLNNGRLLFEANQARQIVLRVAPEGIFHNSITQGEVAVLLGQRHLSEKLVLLSGF